MTDNGDEAKVPPSDSSTSNEENEKEKVGSACGAAINVPPSSTVAPLFQTLMPHPLPKLIQVAVASPVSVVEVDMQDMTKE